MNNAVHISGRNINNTVHMNIFRGSQSPKFKRVSLNETFEFPFWRPNICIDFDLRDSKKIENMKKLNNMIFHKKHMDIHKTT